MDYDGLRWTTMGYHELPWTTRATMDYHGLFNNYHGLFMDYDGLS